MITPTVGRVVWFHPEANMDQPYAAIIAHIWSDRCVNLAYFDANGNSRSATSVPLVQDEDRFAGPDAFYCEWMPYQKGQAAKTEQLQAVVEKTSPENAITENELVKLVKREEYVVFPDSTTIVCCLYLNNGFTVTGESSCVDPANFSEQLGRKYAFEKAIDKLWELEGYVLNDKLRMKVAQ